MSRLAEHGRVLYLWPNSVIAPYCSEPWVEKLDPYSIFFLGAALHPIGFLKAYDYSLKGGTTYGDADRVLMVAEGMLSGALDKNALNLEASLVSGRELLMAIRAVRKDRTEDFSKRAEQLDLICVGMLHDALKAFENVLRAEMPRVPLYLVGKKGGYSVPALIDDGEVFFPADLAKKVPEAIPDIKQGARCIAFELPTAAGYHFHRANEAVLRKYWDAVTGGAERPSTPSAGIYVKLMRDRKLGDPLVLASLADLVKLRRNPLAHPDQSINNVNDAVAVMNAVQTAITEMLKTIA